MFLAHLNAQTRANLHSTVHLSSGGVVPGNECILIHGALNYLKKLPLSLGLLIVCQLKVMVLHIK